MKTLEELYYELDEYHKNFDDWDNVIKFLDTAREIVEHNDEASIPVLLSYFDDNDDTDFVLEDLSGILERYGNERYIKEILKNLNILFPNAIDWAVNLVVIMFNRLSDFELLKKYIFLAKKDALLQILQKIKCRTEKHRALVSELEIYLNIPQDTRNREKDV